MWRQSTRGRSTGSGGGEEEESEAPAAAVHAGRISSEDAAARRQNIRGGGGASEEEKRSLRVWSDVLAGGGGAKYSAWRGWMDRVVDGWTPLHLAIQSRNRDITMILLVNGADETRRNKELSLAVTDVLTCAYAVLLSSLRRSWSRGIW
uniref:Uncharacterized protein n=1 Tax=Oryza glaberrima TaxID=4538 RepID=I1QT95_ORYGL